MFSVRSMVAAVAVSVLTFVACGGDEGTTDEETSGAVGQACETSFDCPPPLECDPVVKLCFDPTSTTGSGNTGDGTDTGAGGDDDDGDTGTNGTGGTGSDDDDASTGDDDDDETGGIDVTENQAPLPTSDLEICLKGNEGEFCTEPGVPPQYDFGPVKAGETSETITVTVTNKGAAAIAIATTDKVLGVTQEHKLSEEPVNKTLQPGEKIEMTATYAPTGHGADLAAWIFNAGAAGVDSSGFALVGTGIAPKLCPDPNFSMNFPNVLAGTTASQEVVFSNCGSASFKFTGVSLSPQGPFSVTSDPQPSETISAGETFKVRVEYVAAPGNATANLTLSTDIAGAAGTGTIAVTGNGIAPSTGCALKVGPPSLAFGRVNNGSASSALVTLVNDGAQPCQINGFAVTGPGFALENAPTTPLTLGAGGSSQVGVKFTSSGTAASGQLTVTPSAGAAVKVALSANPGVKQDCDLAILPGPVVDFGAVSAQKDINIALVNLASTSCTLTKSALTANTGFSVPNAAQLPSSGFPPSDIEIGPTGSGTDSHTITVRYKPGLVAFEQAQLTLTSADNPFFGGEVVATIGLTARTAKAALCATPTTQNFGVIRVGASATRGINISNCGAGPAEVAILRFDGGGGGFVVESAPTLPFTLQPGASQSVDVRFSANLPGKSAADFLAITRDGSSVAVSLTAEARNSCELACRASTYDFGPQYLEATGLAKFFCANFGLAPRKIERISLFASPQADFQLTRAALPITVNPGQSTSIEVRYTPGTISTANATMYVEATGCEDEQIAIPIKGQGIDSDKIAECPGRSSYNPQLKWEWTGKNGKKPECNQVFMTPSVGHLNDDNGDRKIDDFDRPDIVVSAHCGGIENLTDPNAPAYVKIIDGKTGDDVYQFTDDDYWGVNFSGALGLGDLDGDGVPEIVGVKYRKLPQKNTCGQLALYCGGHAWGTLLAFKYDAKNQTGELLWESDEWTGNDNDLENYGSPYMADLDGDGSTEVIFGAHVYRADGSLWWRGKAARGNDGRGFLSIVADLDNDGLAEVIAGNTAYRYNGDVFWTAPTQGSFGAEEGPVAIADLDLDGTPEVIISTASGIWYVSHTGQIEAGPLLGPGAGCCNTPPSINDLDGDGYPEVVVSNRPVLRGSGDPNDPDQGYLTAIRRDGSVLWSELVTDLTGAAAPTSFDFEGDGKAEVVYADENNIYIFNGPDGTELYRAGRFSRTGLDKPIIADVDNNAHADLLVTQEGGFGGGAGLLCYYTEPDVWRDTRGIWNQLMYNITNVRDDMSIPRVQPDPWRTHNTFHANVPYCRPKQNP